MRWGVLALVTVSACGRIDFAAGPHDAAAADAAGTSDGDFLSALACETDVTVAAVPRADEMTWIATPATKAIAVLVHVDNTHHELRIYPLSVQDAAIVAAPPIVAYATVDMVGIQIAEVPPGFVALHTNYITHAAGAVPLDAAFAPGSAYGFGDLGEASVPYAPGAVIGRSAAYALELQRVDAGLAPIGGASELMPSTEGAERPSITAFAGGYVVGWESGATGHCRFARLDATGARIAGPLDIAAPTTTCLHPLAVPIDATTLAYTIEAGSPSYQLYGGAFDAGLSAATPPVAIGALDSTAQTLLGGDPALVALRTQGDSRVAQIAASGAPTVLGADFGLAGTDIDSEGLARIGTGLVHARSESGALVIRRLCR